ncbi:hypothetical protein LIER_38357 [Lithospermum erythrorhizon]|uniref:F-box protein n=1 Tax=Lithospermum erythrorhizon TaxID=34254 RepID=A0AAV3PYF2_LITER
MNIGVFSDGLTLTCRDYACKETLFEMKSYRAKDSWENLRLDLSPRPYTYNLKPITCMENGKLVILEGIGSLMLYDTKKNQSVRRYHSVGEAHSYIATLGFYGGKLDDAAKEGGKTKRVSKALAYRTSNKRAKL